jgi:excisionase family DNA binding protein
MSQALATQRMLTPPAVAERLGIDAHKVVAWIAAGQLMAVNVSDGAKRPRWRITAAALEQFLLKRQSKPAATPPIKRRRQPAEVIEFF